MLKYNIQNIQNVINGITASRMLKARHNQSPVLEVILLLE